MKKLALLAIICAPSFLSAQDISIIPRPVSLNAGKGSFTINADTKIVVEGSGMEHSVSFLNDYLQHFFGLTLTTTTKAEDKNVIILNFEKMERVSVGAYRMIVNGNHVYIAGANEEGVFYGIQTLIQLLPTSATSSLVIPQLAITDFPRFPYRGLHLDVSRHFFTVDYIKKYIDYIALHKMNYFHWHLTDDQGWRIEIKKYPKLTETGSCRNGTIIGHYPGKGNDSIRYCGFYTQQEIKDVVQYAADRYVTILPEIELPGHASAALTSYPYLGCTGGPYHVQETWGVFSDVFCAGNDSTFQFLQDVLDEVIALFPSKYIHIGGDECPKTAWKKCPKCQKRIQENHLKDEHELQSYVIGRIEKYLNSKGRQVIGWDEILEGGVAPNATVMSWRGEKGGIDAAKQHHTVVMTPTTYVYFDYAQKKNEDSLVIGGFLPLDKVYNYEPLPKELSDDEKKYIIGGQGNIWTEYVPTISKLEYQLFPRVTALCEVLWSPKEGKDWTDFQKRLPRQLERYDFWKTNYSRAYYNLKASIEPADNNKGLLWKLSSNLPNSVIKISAGQGGNEISYDQPFLISSSGSYQANLYKDGKTADQIAASFSFNKATGKNIVLATQPAIEFPGNGGAFGLVNGVVTSKTTDFSEWLGWVGTDMEATIDFGKDETLNKVSVHTYDQKRGRYYQPVSVEVLSSTDGINFTIIGKTSDFIPDHDNLGTMTVLLSAISTRYIKVRAKNTGTIPEGQTGTGNPARMLIDEIQVF